ncbi:MAG: hypothetical protein DMD60_09305 [Gemmatimonadetes bacterium]|nr:MAG: hypothetical protein DMD60_09305 [Gemmatimonadota bacterium]
MIDKMRQAVAATLAVPVLWVSTAAFPIMGLVYCMALVALDGIEQFVRRLHPARPRRQSLHAAGDNPLRRSTDRRGRARDH